MRHLLAELRKLRAFAQAQGAASAVEFALVAPVLIALLLATLQIALVFLAQAYLQSVAESTKRAVLTNQTSGLTPAQFRASMCASVVAMFDCGGLIVSLQSAPKTQAGISSAMPVFKPDGTLAATPTIARIPANTKALLILMYPWPVIAGPLGPYVGTLGDGKYLLSVASVFQTEPCTQASGC